MTQGDSKIKQHVRIEKNLLQRLRKLVTSRRWSLTGAVNTAIEQFLEREEQASRQER